MMMTFKKGCYVVFEPAKPGDRLYLMVIALKKGCCVVLEPAGWSQWDEFGWRISISNQLS
jgi:hypothetical protein